MKIIYFKFDYFKKFNNNKFYIKNIKLKRKIN